MASRISPACNALSVIGVDRAGLHLVHVDRHHRGRCRQRARHVEDLAGLQRAVGDLE